MKSVIFTLQFFIMIIFKGAFAQQNLHNPVFDQDFADPTIIRVGDTYFAYSTNSKVNGNWINIQVAQIKDMNNWNLLGDAMPQKPIWAEKTQEFWAPDVFFDNKLDVFVMFYSVEPDTKIGKCLGFFKSSARSIYR